MLQKLRDSFDVVTVTQEADKSYTEERHGINNFYEKPAKEFYYEAQKPRRMTEKKVTDKLAEIAKPRQVRTIVDHGAMEAVDEELMKRVASDVDPNDVDSSSLKDTGYEKVADIDENGFFKSPSGSSPQQFEKAEEFDDVLDDLFEVDQKATRDESRGDPTTKTPSPDSIKKSKDQHAPLKPNNEPKQNMAAQLSYMYNPLMAGNPLGGFFESKQATNTYKTQTSRSDIRVASFGSANSLQDSHEIEETFKNVDSTSDYYKANSLSFLKAKTKPAVYDNEHNEDLKYSSLLKALYAIRKGDFLQASNCKLIDLMATAKETKIQLITVLPVNGCLRTALRKLAVEQNYLNKEDYGTISSIMVDAIDRIHKAGIAISPFGVKNLMFGKKNMTTKPDDITIITGSVETLNENKMKSQKEASALREKRDGILVELRRNAKIFISNLSKNEQVFADLITKIKPKKMI